MAFSTIELTSAAKAASTVERHNAVSCCEVLCSGYLAMGPQDDLTCENGTEASAAKILIMGTRCATCIDLGLASVNSEVALGA